MPPTVGMVTAPSRVERLHPSGSREPRPDSDRRRVRAIGASPISVTSRRLRRGPGPRDARELALDVLALGVADPDGDPVGEQRQTPAQSVLGPPIPRGLGAIHGPTTNRQITQGTA